MANPLIPSVNRRGTTDELPFPEKRSRETIYKEALEEIVRRSQVLKTNPNCLYILRVAEGALNAGYQPNRL